MIFDGRDYPYNIIGDKYCETKQKKHIGMLVTHEKLRQVQIGDVLVPAKNIHYHKQDPGLRRLFLNWGPFITGRYYEGSERGGYTRNEGMRETMTKYSILIDALDNSKDKNLDDFRPFFDEISDNITYNMVKIDPYVNIKDNNERLDITLPAALFQETVTRLQNPQEHYTLPASEKSTQNQSFWKRLNPFDISKKTETPSPQVPNEEQQKKLIALEEQFRQTSSIINTLRRQVIDLNKKINDTSEAYAQSKSELTSQVDELTKELDELRAKKDPWLTKNTAFTVAGLFCLLGNAYFIKSAADFAHEANQSAAAAAAGKAD
ncbi:MAG: hypothetical protein ACOYK9_06250 [Chlamydiia bacterium]